MDIIKLPSSNAFHSLYELAEIDVGRSLIIKNQSTLPIQIDQANVASNDNSGYSIFPGDTILVHGKPGLDVFAKGPNSKILVQPLTSTITPFTGVELPQYIYTSKHEDYRRIRVDPAQTSFFEGREFRTFRKISIPAGQSVVVRVNVGVDTILRTVSLNIYSGTVELNTYVGGSTAGTLNQTWPILPKNTMMGRKYTDPSMNEIVSTLPALQSSQQIVGGVLIDYVPVAASNATSQQSSVGGPNFDERGVGEGTYYWEFHNISNTTAHGSFSSYWEERTHLIQI